MDTTKKPKRKTVWVTVAALVVVFFAVQLAGHDWATRTLSPGPCKTIDCLANAKPAPRKLAEVRVDGADYIVWFGEMQPDWLVPSGPSCYVFNEHGRLVMWASLTGEGGEIEKFSRPALRADPVNLEAVLERVGRE